MAGTMRNVAMVSRSALNAMLPRCNRRLVQTSAPQGGLRAPSSSDFGARELELLKDDPALRRFKSHGDTVRLLKRIGDVLVIALVGGAVYEIAYRVQALKDQKVEK
ncbi:hypothetical protein CBR_g34554 [Chara braunii]|uniref:Uncharacterized protein n=1 Tax=Chara braunii TaxID=69332 RepID=A0A388LIW0_CHABU|nr:hypothetical protein CBR_g34554 [Chara braunii]|eukprot:GBG82270.1 hypothetical protein CBR_g34554 [Chara braunii]